MRSIEQILKRQIELWEAERQAAGPADAGQTEPAASESLPEVPPARKPVIAISRQLGCGARAVCEILSRRIGYELFGFKILDQVAENNQVRTQLIDRMDQRRRSYMHSMVETWLKGRSVEKEDYLRHLLEVLEAFVLEGGCILLGRGAPYVVAEGVGIRVRLTASREKRIDNIMQYYAIPAAEAERRMQQSDNERMEFSSKLFGKDLNDATQYDLLINLDRVAPSTAAATIVQCMYSMRTHGHEALRHSLREQNAHDLVQRQIQRWERHTKSEIRAMHDNVPGLNALETRERPLPVVALSNKFCVGSRQVAQTLEDRLGYELFGYRIIDQVAGDMRLKPKIIDRLDQRAQTALQSFVDKFWQRASVNRQDYFESLVKTIRALIMQGGLTLLGRGSTQLVEKGEGVRCRLVAPMEKRLHNMKAFYHITGKVAAERLNKADRERADFFKQYFNCNMDDANRYDLSINLDRVNANAAAEVIIQALEPLQQ